jgi:WD40 repeat protein
MRPQPDGRFLTAANVDNKIAVWDLHAPGDPLAEYEDGRSTRAEPIMRLSLLQLSPDKTVLMVPGNDGTTRRIAVGVGGVCDRTAVRSRALARGKIDRSTLSTRTPAHGRQR